ncbi:UNVERIFIED_CONTAM: hypothetical protein Sangu_2663500 [Sesamum angustifolium]|uniref:Uncharacterized protein n=1 Tax=Sesamum angustifolium TaxID=2727405 RepID=A0AAW2J0U8_9LAMI
MATSLAAMTARRASILARLTSSSSSGARASSLIPSRGLAGAAGTDFDRTFPIDHSLL